MENVDQALLDNALQDSFEIKRLYTLHKDLDRKIESLGNRRFLTENEQLMIKQLKKEKLKGKDQLIRLIEQYRSTSIS